VSRMAGGLLRAAGLDDSRHDERSGLRELAVRLAARPEALRTLRHSLAGRAASWQSAPPGSSAASRINWSRG